ncbi:LysR family transcriptional regulator [Nostoc ellipsosporum NOK]|jgi:DNA-binding transcriptional LysR family regulator|nr:LysR family transcriptional regulator [Nostoc ellipsosporum NOK]
MRDFRLKVFQAVAAHLSFTKAAAELFITQPAVTRHIRELEEELGVSLFERKANRVQLTQAGDILLAHAGRVADVYKQIDFDINQLRQRFAGALQLGASTTIGQYILPSLLAGFYEAYPDVKLSLLNGNTQQIETALLDKKIELGFVEGKTRNTQLRYTTFLEDEMVVVAHAQQPLAKHTSLTLKQLATLPLVLRERGSGSLEVVEHALAAHNMRLDQMNPVMQLGSTEGIKSFLRHTNCLGIVSVAALQQELPEKEFRIIPVKGLSIPRTFYVVHLQGKPSGLPATFLQFVRKRYNRK